MGEKDFSLQSKEKNKDINQNEKIKESNLNFKKEESTNDESTIEESTKVEIKLETKEEILKADAIKEEHKDSEKDDLKNSSKNIVKKNDSKILNDKKANENAKVMSAAKKIADAKAVQKQGTQENFSEDVIQTKTVKNKKSFKPFLITFAILIMVIYLGGVYYFSNNFYPNIFINDYEVSNSSLHDAQIELEDFYKNYQLSINTIDHKEIIIHSDDIGMSIVLDENFTDCIQQQKPIMWFITIFKEHHLIANTTVKFDDVVLKKRLSDLDILDEKQMKKPINAYIGIQDNRLSIIKEVNGTTIYKDKFHAAVKDALLHVKPTLDLKSEGCYVLPKITETNEALQNELKGKQKYANHDIQLQMDDLTLDLGMEIYSKVLEKNGNEYKVSKKLVDEYVAALANKYDTYDKERVFTTSFDDKTVKVLGEGLGYQIDQEATSKNLYDALNNNQSCIVDAVFKEKGITLNGMNDIGDSYIEVNLSEQKVIAYKNGKKIIEGDCVSGKEVDGHGTTIGLYRIQNKLSPTILRGEKKPVTKTIKKKKKGKTVKIKKTTYEYEYESPVTYWMQFNGGYGLHDAVQWRSAYGGNIYYYSGSHGCVNLTYDVAETLYQNFDVGDPVVVYFWDNENRR